jgi:hypothetical protein
VRKHSNGTAAYKPIQNTFRNSIGPKDMEPTSGLEPLTCRLRIGCSTN